MTTNSIISLPIQRVVSTDRRFISKPEATPDMLSLIGIDPKWQHFVRILDKEGPLVLVHYITVTLENSEEPDNEVLSQIGEARGIIIDTENNKIVCRSYPYTPENTFSDIPEGDAYKACEGTVLRLFNFHNKWYLSTHRKINAMNSYWAGPTFGELFNQIKQFEYDSLDKNYCYVFLMSHDDNRLVYKVVEPQLLVITVYNQATTSFLVEGEYTLPKGTKAPVKVFENNKASVFDVHDAVIRANSFDYSGLLFVANSRYPKPVKIINKTYDQLKKARGNNPNLRTRYLQLRGTEDGKLLVNWFNETRYNQEFDAAEKDLDELIRFLHSVYMNRYVEKNFSDLPKEEFVTIQKCHNWHKMDRRKNIVTENKVREVVNQTHPKYVLTMVKRLKNMMKESFEQEFE